MDDKACSFKDRSAQKIIVGDISSSYTDAKQIRVGRSQPLNLA